MELSAIEARIELLSIVSHYCFKTKTVASGIPTADFRWEANAECFRRTGNREWIHACESKHDSGEGLQPETDTILGIGRGPICVRKGFECPYAPRLPQALPP